ncbi:MAG: Fe-S cluster assembly ATPase SufC [Candidatus Gottesmanbacteria bacterium]
MLKITNLSVSVGNKKIINNLSLEIRPGELHVLLGPNGAGKTSLAMALIGHPSYKIENQISKIKIDDKDLIHLTTDERARLGLFNSFQKPVAIPGVSVKDLLKYIKINNLEEKISKTGNRLKIKDELLTRSLNVDFSGGEFKKMELLQAMIIQPKYVILDEIDSGLDIDNIHLLADFLQQMTLKNIGILLITHNLRILKFVKPDLIHILINGSIIKSGGVQIAREIEKRGFSWLVKN